LLLLACSQVLVEERLADAANRLGHKFRQELSELIPQTGGFVTIVRGKGMLNAIVIQVRPFAKTGNNEVVTALKPRPLTI
jgi:acetylornithine/succinyldiaminopimelate/putrescine aminotransferase